MENYTKEPLVHTGTSGRVDRGDYKMNVFTTPTGSEIKERIANARRLCAAWNYCEGVPTAELESKGADAGFWGQACSRLQTERDKLREENTRLLAAVAEMEKMLPVLEDLHKVQRLNITQIDEPALNAYRLALQTALAKRTEP